MSQRSQIIRRVSRWHTQRHMVSDAYLYALSTETDMQSSHSLQKDYFEHILLWLRLVISHESAVLPPC